MGGARAFGKLTKAAEFQQVRRQGTRLRGQLVDIYVLPRADGHGPRLGLVVSRKVGIAVARNRWKRLIRACMHLRAGILGSVDLVVVAKTPPPASLWDFASDFDVLWSRFAGSSSA
jgi:ribonuclease P protein component